MNPLQTIDPELYSLVSGTSRAARQRPQQPAAFDDEQERSVLGTLRDKSIGTLAAVGNVLDLPGSMVRDVATGNNPLDQLLPWNWTSSDNRATGRDLARQFGMAGRRDTWGNAIGGFGLEVALDPLTYMTFGASALGKSGQAAKAAGLMDDVAKVAARKAGVKAGTVGKRQQRLGTTLQDILEFGDEPARAKARTLIDEGADATESLGGSIGLGLPFQDPMKVIGTGPRSMQAAKFLDDAGQAIRFAQIPGTGVAPVDATARAFDATIGGAKTAFGQAIARQTTRDKQKVGAAAKLRAIKLGERFREAGIDDEQFGDLLRTEGELVTPEAIASLPSFMQERYSDAMGKLSAIPGGLEELKSVASDMRDQFKSVLDRTQQAGGKLADLSEADDYVNYMPRFLAADLGIKPQRDRRLLASFDPSQQARADELRNVPGGTYAVKEMFRDPKVREIKDRIARGESDKDLLEAYLNKTHGGWLSDTYKVFDKEKGEWADTDGRYKALTNRMLSLKPETLELGVFGNHPIVDAEVRFMAAENAIKSAENMLDALAQPEVIKSDDAILAAGESIGDYRQVRDIVKDAGLKYGDETEGFMKLLSDKFGGAKISEIGDMRVRKDEADDLLKMMEMGKGQEPVREWLKIVDGVTNFGKGMWTNVWPAFHVRNFISGTAHNFLKGMVNLRSLNEAWNYNTGKNVNQDDLLKNRYVRQQLYDEGFDVDLNAGSKNATGAQSTANGSQLNSGGVPDVMATPAALERRPNIMNPLEHSAIKQRLMDSPEFSEWFFGSKAVDDAGEPLILMHGTDSAGFSEFSKDKLAKNTKARTARLGYFFTDNPDTADMFSNLNDNANAASGVYPVALSLKNPLEIHKIDDVQVQKLEEAFPGISEVIENTKGAESKKTRHWERNEQFKKRITEYYSALSDVPGSYVRENTKRLGSRAAAADAAEARAKELRDAGYTVTVERHPEDYGSDKYYLHAVPAGPTEKELAEFDNFRVVQHMSKDPDARQKLKSLGYDGIHVVTDVDSPGYKSDTWKINDNLISQWIAFEPEQIKSATGNRGTFDPNNPDILATRKGSEKAPVMRALQADKQAIPNVGNKDINAWTIDDINAISDPANFSQISPQHKLLNDHLDNLVKQEGIKPEDAQIMRLIYAQSNAQFMPKKADAATSMKSFDGKPVRNALGFAEPESVFGKYGAVDRVSLLAKRPGQSAYNEGTRVLLHEMAHIAYFAAKDSGQYDDAIRDFIKLGSENKKLLKDEFANAGDLNPRYHSGMSRHRNNQRNPEWEQFAEFFAQSVMRRKIPTGAIGTIIKDALAWLKDRLVKLGAIKGLDPAVRKRMDEIVDQIGGFDQSPDISGIRSAAGQKTASTPPSNAVQPPIPMGPAGPPAGAPPAVPPVPVAPASPPPGKRKKVTPEAVTRIFREMLYAYQVVGKFEGNATDVVGRAGNLQGGSLQDMLTGVVSPGQSALQPGRVARKMTGMEPGVTLDPRKATFRGGWSEATESTWGPSAAGEEIGYFTEGMNRVAPFHYLLSQGVEPAEAAKRVADAQVNYSNRNFTPFEQQVMKRLLPFYSFSSRVGPEVVKEIAQRPGGRLATAVKAQAEMQDQSDTAPDYVRETASFPLGDMLGPVPEGTDRYLTGLGLMHEDPFSFGPNVKGAALEFASRTNPFVKAPLELMTGQSFFQKGPDGGRSLDDMDPLVGRLAANVGLVDDKNVKFLPTWMEQIIANSPAARGLSTARQLTDSRKRWSPDVPLPGPASLLNTLTGVRVTDVSPGAKDAIVRELLEREMKDTGAAAFERIYYRKEDLAKMSPEEQESAMRLQALANVLAKRAKERKERKEREQQGQVN
jgi:hypothetical protein